MRPYIFVLLATFASASETSLNNCKCKGGNEAAFTNACCTKGTTFNGRSLTGISNQEGGCNFAPNAAFIVIPHAQIQQEFAACCLATSSGQGATGGTCTHIQL
ncbi:hypothetical protein MGG_15458 [Pyricularia oryzae 70-15]|uniref:Uncharacterized protein n=1 Tax=Pyricularia oryzae (strain 70-15 / ATCC MYA-4617 / FGSC 8958) TaxID=242507 RepID=G4MMM9_PYRO7|nr:uncharacterized protein MGG_15458 [Pyricularia oryzae 70-15]EHA57801.1 hypothetical protein MGG_15458 [Pyricularia oryzae 70-15]KAI7909578.1 hypothetical protein M9X92_011553 [Pyricularia oryzae]KAI7910023.1 hypothetical protein M0657_011561 [Pyricularia oryzae]